MLHRRQDRWNEFRIDIFSNFSSSNKNKISNNNHQISNIIPVRYAYKVGSLSDLNSDLLISE